jgi:hypothetical protein
VKAGHLRAEHHQTDNHGGRQHGQQHADAADQAPPFPRVLDGTADREHYGECDGGPSDNMREH